MEDQLIVGESIMLAPVYLQNAVGRSVYLPEDMKLIRFRSCEDYEEEICEACRAYLLLVHVVIVLDSKFLDDF